MVPQSLLAVRTLRAAASPATEDRVVPLSPKIWVGLRFQAAARATGVEQVTAHSGRVGLASAVPVEQRPERPPRPKPRPARWTAAVAELRQLSPKRRGALGRACSTSATVALRWYCLANHRS